MPPALCTKSDTAMLRLSARDSATAPPTSAAVTPVAPVWALIALTSGCRSETLAMTALITVALDDWVPNLRLTVPARDSSLRFRLARCAEMMAGSTAVWPRFMTWMILPAEMSAAEEAA